jgi:catechol 2,3-dioxygenase-like lactoylglutathione lyase family enzyme
MSDANACNASPTAVECIIPILGVKDLQASISFYVDVLGFKVDWNTATMASVSRDGRAIMLCEGDQGQPGTWIWIGVEDIEPLFEELVAKDVTIRQRPTNYRFAYEMRIEDPDGHVLRFGSEPKRDRPFV